MTQKNSEDLVNYIVNCNIWKYIMSKTPWWGGFLGCLVGIMKRTLSNLVGKRFLSYGVQEDVLLDIECMMNNRMEQLYCQGEELSKPVLTPNTLLNRKEKILFEKTLQKGHSIFKSVKSNCINVGCKNIFMRQKKMHISKSVKEKSITLIFQLVLWFQ